MIPCRLLIRFATDHAGQQHACFALVANEESDVLVKAINAEPAAVQQV